MFLLKQNSQLGNVVDRDESEFNSTRSRVFSLIYLGKYVMGLYKTILVRIGALECVILLL